MLVSPARLSAALRKSGPKISFSTTTEMMSVANAVPRSGNWTATSRASPSAMPAWVM